MVVEGPGNAHENCLKSYGKPLFYSVGRTVIMAQRGDEQQLMLHLTSLTQGQVDCLLLWYVTHDVGTVENRGGKPHLEVCWIAQRTCVRTCQLYHVQSG